MAGPRAPVAIDTQQIQTRTEWSYFWGLRQSEWTPDPTGCDGKGAGRVEVHFAWFTAPLMLLTLGVAVPAEVAIYCDTEQAPSNGP